MVMRGAKKPRRAVSMAAMASKLKRSLSTRWVEEKTDARDSSESERLRLRTILMFVVCKAVGGNGDGWRRSWINLYSQYW